MNLATAIADDLALFDNLQSGTYTSVRNSGNATAVITKALKEEVSAREAAFSFGVYQHGDTRWHIRSNELPGITPKPGDHWLSGGVDWTVLTASLETLSSRWELACRNMVVHHDLRSLVDYYEPVPAKDAAGFRKVGHQVKYLQKAARIQELAGQQFEARAKKGDRQSFAIYLADQLDVTTDGYFLHAGKRYSVVRWTNKQRIDELMMVEAILDFSGK